MTLTAQRIIFIGWAIVSLSVGFFFFQLTSLSSGSEYRQFEITKGNGFSGIAQSLYEKKFIRSPKVFMVYGVLTGVAHQLKPGIYELSPASSTPSIVETLRKGPAVDIGVTLPEGGTLKDADVIFSRAGVIMPGSLEKLPIRSLAEKYSFLKNAKSIEGFLFPDTYRFYPKSDPKDIAEKMLDTFALKAWPILEECKVSTKGGSASGGQSAKCQGLDFFGILTIASLLEKEVPDFYDRQLVAGIMYRRLAIGMALQIDATIAYAKCNGTFITCANPKVYRKDLTYKSVYNTYLFNGLPPGPISNPGSEAIKAAVNPIKSDYMYYLSDPKTGKTIFSKTLDEHNENRAKYL